MDVTDITEAWSDMPEGARKLSDLLEADIYGLEEIIGNELTYDDLDNAMRSSPSLIIEIVRRIV